jgi:stage V sporulation protein B
VIGGAAALAVMLYYAVKLRRRDAGERLSAETPGGRSTSFSPIQGWSVKTKPDAASQLSYKQIYVRLFQLSIPIVLFSMTVTLIYSLDTSFIHYLLRNLFDFEQRREIIGIMAGRAQSLAGIPIILAIALSQSVVPLISAAHTQGLHDQLQKHTTRVLQLAILSGLPLVLMISTAARPIDAFVFGYDKSSAYGIEISPHIIALLTVSAIFQIIMQTSGAVLMGLGRMKPLVLSVILGVSVKIAGNYLLSPSMGIYGIAVSTGLCFVVMSYWNLYILRKNVKFTIFSPRKWLGLLVSTAIIALIGVGLEKLTHTYVHLLGLLRLNEGINAAIVCVVVLLLYPLLLGAMRVVTKADIEQFPASLQRLIGKVARLLGRKPPTAKMPQ